MKKFVFALDLDGTLIQDDSSLSFTTIQQIHEWVKQGVNIIITTGRTWLNTKKIYQLCRLSTPVVLYNGAYVYIPKENRVLQSFTLQKEFLHTLFLNKEFMSMVNRITCEYQEQQFDFNLMQTTPEEMIQSLNINPTSFILEVKGFEVQEKIKKIIEENPLYGYRFGGDDWGEVYLKNISKREGIAVVLDYFNLTQKNLVFFGDSENDVEIIQYAKLGIAMKNAREEIKQVADKVTLEDNNHDGVIKSIQSILLSKEESL